jgi:uncharacterized membrane protein
MTGREKLYRALAIFLGLLVIAALIAVVVTVAFPPSPEPYTEFYILGPGGKATGYPSQFPAGSEQTVIVGIVSHEPEAATYRVEVGAGGPVIARAGPVVLAPLEKWEQPLVFRVDTAGDRQRVTFLLHKDGEAEVYRSLFLLVNVTP